MIENIDTKKRYIGVSCNIKKRVKLHERALRKGFSINRKIDEDIDLGYNRFFVAVLETFDDGTITKLELMQKENEYITQWNTLQEYNISLSNLMGRFKRNELLYSHGTLLRREEAKWKREKQRSEPVTQSGSNGTKRT